jgi:hypothetical protein
MKQQKITKIKMRVTTCKRNTKPVSTSIVIPINDHQTAVDYTTAIGAKMKEFEAHILNNIAAYNKPE